MKRRGASTAAHRALRSWAGSTVAAVTSLGFPAIARAMQPCPAGTHVSHEPQIVVALGAVAAVVVLVIGVRRAWREPPGGRTKWLVLGIVGAVGLLAATFVGMGVATVFLTRCLPS